MRKQMVETGMEVVQSGLGQAIVVITSIVISIIIILITIVIEVIESGLGPAGGEGNLGWLKRLTI